MQDLRKAQLRWERYIDKDPMPSGHSKERLNQLSESFIATELPQNGVDDLYVSVMVEDLSGTPFAGVFAVAGPSLFGLETNYNGNEGVRYKVTAGRIRLNKARYERAMSRGYMENLLVHELGHVLGIGTLWGYQGLIADKGTYTGKHATQAWHDLGCSGDLPVDPESKMHWQEGCLVHEVMNPNFYQHHKDLFSTISMGALEDLGYSVNYKEADDMNLSDLSASKCRDYCPEAKGRRHLGEIFDNIPSLSQAAVQEILRAAAAHFRELPLAFDDDKGSTAFPSVVSILYEESGQFHSRLVHRHESRHLE